jgi:hypothetical protein
VASIDDWAKNSRYPFGHFVRRSGELGDRDTENKVILIEQSVPYYCEVFFVSRHVKFLSGIIIFSFSDNILSCLPKPTWRMSKKIFPAALTTGRWMSALLIRRAALYPALLTVYHPSCARNACLGYRRRASCSQACQWELRGWCPYCRCHAFRRPRHAIG